MVYDQIKLYVMDGQSLSLVRGFVLHNDRMSHTSASLARVPRARARAVSGPAVRGCVLPDGVGGRGDEGWVGRSEGRCRDGAHTPLQCVNGELEGEAARDGVHKAPTVRAVDGCQGLARWLVVDRDEAAGPFAR